MGGVKVFTPLERSNRKARALVSRNCSPISTWHSTRGNALPMHLRMHNTAFGLTRKLFSVQEKSYRHVECPMGTLLYSVASVYLASHKESYEWNVFSLFVCKQRKRLGNNWTKFFNYTYFLTLLARKKYCFCCYFFLSSNIWWKSEGSAKHWSPQ